MQERDMLQVVSCNPLRLVMRTTLTQAWSAVEDDDFKRMIQDVGHEAAVEEGACAIPAIDEKCISRPRKEPPKSPRALERMATTCCNEGHLDIFCMCEVGDHKKGLPAASITPENAFP